MTDYLSALGDAYRLYNSSQRPSSTFNSLNQAATGARLAGNLTGSGSLNRYGGDLGDALNIYSGVESGKPLGYLGAGLSATRLGGDLTGTAVPSWVSPASGLLGIYSGLKSGTPLGYAQTAMNAARLYGTLQNMGLIGSGASSGAAAGTGAAAGASGGTGAGASSAALGAGLGASLATIGAMAPVIAGTRSSPVTVGKDYWEGLSNTLKSGNYASTNAGYNANTTSDWRKTNYDQTLISMLMGGGPQSMGTSAAQHLPPDVQKYITDNGLDKAAQDEMQAMAHPILAGGQSPWKVKMTQYADGGPMRSTDLRDIYRGSFAKRLRHFDEGGSYYDNYVGLPGYGNYATGTPNYTDISGDLPPVSSVPAANVPTTGYNYPGAARAGSNYSQSSPAGSLSGLLQALGVSGGAADRLGALTPLLPLLGALLQKNPKAPELPSQYTGTPMNISTPNYKQTPSNAYKNMSMNDWLHVAEQPGGMPQFYTNNALPPTANSAPNQQIPTSAPAPAAPNYQIKPILRPIMGRAHGGYMSPSYVTGPGDGTSDDINAKLSNGEYVIDAPTVSLLGNGSNEAGAKALDQMRINVRKHAGAKLARGKQPMHAHPPERYLSAEYS